MRLWRIHWRGCAALRKGALGALQHQRPSANAKNSIVTISTAPRFILASRAVVVRAVPASWSDELSRALDEARYRARRDGRGPAEAPACRRVPVPQGKDGG